MLAALLVGGWVGFSGGVGQIREISWNSWLLIGIEAILATVIGDLAYYAAIKKGNVSLVTIIMSSSPLITMICSVIFLGEPLTSWRIIGAGYIIMGIILII
jgi:transporter family protein